MSEFITRSASLGDLETLLEFEQGIIAFERPYDPTLKKDPISYYDLGELIKSNEAQVVVIEFNGRLVASGYAKIRPAKPYLYHETYSYLGFMYTHPDFRGKGLNKKVVKALRDWSISKGITEIRLTVYDENDAAIKAYEKAGFKKHIIEMRIVDLK
ncbi:GNAT family N-acetyltransferase [uncultured Zobellia sp.]|uniref:GNAT family N-acetyltransferase n=1 Tax=uncultured Zobellia sp. TaxID=255433 RepID=UPI002592BC70|nr:GNAT family N-acetyltransferase [uncultured Zobellia sp.]